jgi:mitochondrial fission protein ELM1
MRKQVNIHGQRVKLYSLDGGRSWSSSPQSIVACGQRKTMLRLELQKGFERIDGMQEPDPNIVAEIEIPRGFNER